jgi:hypothetical protein
MYVCKVLWNSLFALTLSRVTRLGEFFAQYFCHWAIVYIGQFFLEIYISIPLFSMYICKGYASILTKRWVGLCILWAIISKTHLVTLTLRYAKVQLFAEILKQKKMDLLKVCNPPSNTEQKTNLPTSKFVPSCKLTFGRCGVQWFSCYNFYAIIFLQRFSRKVFSRNRKTKLSILLFCTTYSFDS